MSNLVSAYLWKHGARSKAAGGISPSPLSRTASTTWRVTSNDMLTNSDRRGRSESCQHSRFLTVASIWWIWPEGNGDEVQNSTENAPELSNIPYQARLKTSLGAKFAQCPPTEGRLIGIPPGRLGGFEVPQENIAQLQSWEQYWCRERVPETPAPQAD